MVSSSPGAPKPVADLGVGPPAVAGRAEDVGPALVRLTAPNPGMMTGPGTNTYLVGHGDVAVVDPGPRDAGHLEAVCALAAARGERIRWVVTTHTHPDHAPGAADLAARTGAEVVGFEARDGFAPHICAREGFAIEGGSFRLEAVHTPGHASNHLCWLHTEPGILLSGDHVMHGATVVIRPLDGDMTAYLLSLARLEQADPPLRAIAPGHGRLIGDPSGAVRGIREHRLEREAVVAAALAAAGRARVDDLLGEVYADVDAGLFGVARYSLWAHLRKLREEGRAAAGQLSPGEESAGREASAAGEHVELQASWEATSTTSPRDT